MTVFRNTVKNNFLKEKVKKGRSNFQKRPTKHSSIVANYSPPLSLQEVFRAMLKKHPEIGMENIDEIRKIFFMYFQFHKKVIEDGAIVSVNLPYLGRIIPGESAVKAQMNFLSLGVLGSKDPDFIVKQKYYLYLHLLRKIHKEKTNFLTNKGILNHEQFDEGIQKDYTRWYAAFKKRAIHIGEYEDCRFGRYSTGFFL